MPPPPTADTPRPDRRPARPGGASPYLGPARPPDRRCVRRHTRRRTSGLDTPAPVWFNGGMDNTTPTQPTPYTHAAAAAACDAAAEAEYSLILHAAHDAAQSAASAWACAIEAEAGLAAGMPNHVADEAVRAAVLASHAAAAAAAAEDSDEAPTAAADARIQLAIAAQLATIATEAEWR